MPRHFISTNAFSSVAAGSQATLDLPVGDLVYHGLQLTYDSGAAGGPTQTQMESDLTEIRIKVDGKEQRRFSARELFDILAFYGIPVEVGDATNPGRLWIPFAEGWRRAAVGEDSLAWGTADISTLQIEVDVASGATSPTLQARALVDRIRRPMGPIVKWRRFNVAVSATGLRTLTTLPRQEAYYAIHCDSSNVADVEVKLDQGEVFKGTKLQVDAVYQQAGRGYSPQSDWFHIVFDGSTGRVSDALAMVRGTPPNLQQVQELRVDFNMSAATGFNVITQTVGPRD